MLRFTAATASRVPHARLFGRATRLRPLATSPPPAHPRNPPHTSAGGGDKSDHTSGETRDESALQRDFWGPRAEHARYSRWWWWDQAVVMLVFACTGSSTAFVVRPLLSNYAGYGYGPPIARFPPPLTDFFALSSRSVVCRSVEGSFKDGPNSYRVISLVAMMPIYSCLLVAFGTAFGRHHYFKRFALNMWRRFLPAAARKRLGMP